MQPLTKTGALMPMTSYFDTNMRHNLRGDIEFGGITAGVVALPLALAFGEASGAGPIAGMWGAIFVGFFAALFGGTGSQVSGPTDPMVVVFAGVFASLQRRPGAGVCRRGAGGPAAGNPRLPEDGAVHPTGALPGRVGLHERDRLHHYRPAGFAPVRP